MIGEKRDHERDDEPINALSRRDFVKLSGGLAVAAGSVSGTELPVIETDADVKTPDGTCDAIFIHPTKGSHPGVVLWRDSPRLRPVICDLSSHACSGDID